ncbi:MAG: hypothetical protein ABI337_06025 [Nitrososphaera sp.]
MIDRDVVASMNIAYKWWSRFCHPRGILVEPVKENIGLFEPLIPSVDGNKLVEVA